MPLFIYCGTFDQYDHAKLKEIFLKKMNKYGIKSSILTILKMWRRNLITKEKVKKAYRGELKNDKDWEIYEGSISDDLEESIINLQNQNELKNEEEVHSFFLSKLTKKELKLVQEGNEEHLKTGIHATLGQRTPSYHPVLGPTGSGA